MTDWPEELVGLTEIAQRWGMSRQYVWTLTKWKGFPAPLARLAMGPVYLWVDVQRWREAHGGRHGPIHGGPELDGGSEM